MKRIVYAFFALIFLIFSVIIPDFSSFADVVNQYMVNDVFDFSQLGFDGFQTLENYNDNYDLLTGDDKQNISFGGFDNLADYQNNIYGSDGADAFYHAFVNSISNNITRQGYLNFSDLYFTPIVYQNETIPLENCGYFVRLWADNYGTYLGLYLTYSPSNNEIYFTGSSLTSQSTFYISSTVYTCTEFTDDNVDNLYYTYQTSGYSGTQDDYYVVYDGNTAQIYHRDNMTNVIFSSFPLYYTSKNVTGQNYDSKYYYYYNLYYALSHDVEVGVGFCQDRRVPEMTNSEDQEDILNDVDLMQFEGDLGFEYFDFKGYITENQGLIFPNYIVNYKLNNYTDLRKDNIEIYADYSFDFKLTFQMAGNQMYGYQSANMGTMGFMDMLPVNQNTYGMDLNAYMDDNTFVNYRETAGLHLQSNGIRDYENIQNFNPNSMIADFGRYFYQIMNNVSANKVVNSKRDSYFYITCEFWIEYVNENGRRVQSNKIIRKIDYWGDSSDPSSNLTPVVTDIDSSGIIDDDQAYHDFIDSYNYKKINDDTDGYLNYLPSTSNNSNQSSVGDITIYQNPYPYVLVDIPENQWLNGTPNLKTLLTDFKTMLAETKEGSILNFFPEVYNYFPAPVWSYLIYGIGICLMIGIWRGITRR